MNNIIATVINEYKWLPDYVGSLFFDEIDYRGVLFWYNEIIKNAEEIKNKK